MENDKFPGETSVPQYMNEYCNLHDPVEFVAPLNAASTENRIRAAHVRNSNCDKPWNYDLKDDVVRKIVRNREEEVRNWRKSLKDEKDLLDSASVSAESCMADIVKSIRHFENILQASHNCWQYRKNFMPNLDNDDELLNLFGHEICILRKGLEDSTPYVDELKNWLFEFQRSNASMMQEADLKLQSNTNTLMSVQATLPVNWSPCSIGNQPQPNCSDEKFNLEAKRLIMSVKELKFNMMNCCTSANDTLETCKSQLGNAWAKTNYYLEEEIHAVERAIDVARQTLHLIAGDISDTTLRLDLARDEFNMRSHQRSLGMYRTQLLGKCFCNHHVCDAPIENINAAVMTADERMNELAIEQSQRDQKLLKDAIDLNRQQSKYLEELGQRLYIDREKCLGIRRSINVPVVVQNTLF